MDLDDLVTHDIIAFATRLIIRTAISIIIILTFRE